MIEVRRATNGRHPSVGLCANPCLDRCACTRCGSSRVSTPVRSPTPNRRPMEDKCTGHAADRSSSGHRRSCVLFVPVNRDLNRSTYSYSCIVYAHGSWEERLLEHDSVSLSAAPTSNAMPDDSMQTTSPSEKSAGETAVNRACGSRSGGGLHALRQELSAGESDNIPRPNSHRGSDDANV